MADNFSQNQNNDFTPNSEFTTPVNPQTSFDFNQPVQNPNEDYMAYNQPNTVQPNPDQTVNTDFYNDFAPQQTQYETQVEQPQYDQLNLAPGDYQNTVIQPAAATKVPVYQDYSATPNPYGAYPDEQNTAAAPKSTFQEKKTGNRLFFIIAGVIILLLVGGLGFLFYNNSKNQPASPAQTNNTTVPTVQTSVVTPPATVTFDNILTGGPTSPATAARKYNLAELPADWILSKFTSVDRDSAGKCLNDKVCGASADADDDNLTNLDEYNFQTDPLLNDTDKDGLADGDEIYVYYSDPLKSDSDNDSYKDGSEMSNCYDPISSASSKTDKVRLSKITSAVGLKKLKEPTITTLKAAGATAADLDKGYVELKCADAAVDATISTTSTPPTTTTSATTNTSTAVNPAQ